MEAPQSLRRRTGAERVSVSLADAGGSLPLPLASGRTLIPGIGAFLACGVVAAIAWEQLASWRTPEIRTLLDRGIVLLKALWVIGLWAGAVALLGLAIVLLFYRETARLAGTHLVHVARLGPLRLAMEYDLAKVLNLRVVETGDGRARVHFGYDGVDRKLGGDLPAADAEARLKVIQSAIDRRNAARPSQAGTAPSPPG